MPQNFEDKENCFPFADFYTFTLMPIQAIAIFCGSQKGNNLLYEQHAEELGKIITANNMTLIYGGGKNGLMGVAANSVLDNGGKVYGIIPKVLVEWESQHEGITELLVVEDMHIRKRTIYERCDAAIILPGGFGSLDELFEILTWNQLAIHDKKIFILNSNGFYDALLLHMQKVQEEGFLYGELNEKFVVLQEPNELIPFL
jgi:uncharacterized protein (TIGR00730 family)